MLSTLRLTGTVASLAEVWGRDAAWFEDRLRSTASWDERIGIVVDVLGRRHDARPRVDSEVAHSEFLASLFPGVGFGLHSGVPDVDGSRSSGADGLRIGPSGILTIGPDGTATSGTLYVRGRRGQYAVRILGVTGRTRVLRFHAGTAQWTTN